MRYNASAVILAAGSSTRMGFDKLGFDLGGETVLARSLRAFDRCPLIGELIVVTGADDALPRREAARCTKPVRLVPGGATRADRQQGNNLHQPSHQRKPDPTQHPQNP